MDSGLCGLLSVKAVSFQEKQAQLPAAAPARAQTRSSTCVTVCGRGLRQALKYAKSAGILPSRQPLPASGIWSEKSKSQEHIGWTPQAISAWPAGSEVGDCGEEGEALDATLLAVAAALTDGESDGSDGGGSDEVGLDDASEGGLEADREEEAEEDAQPEDDCMAVPNFEDESVQEVTVQMAGQEVLVKRVKKKKRKKKKSRHSKKLCSQTSEAANAPLAEKRPPVPRFPHPQRAEPEVELLPAVSLVPTEKERCAREKLSKKLLLGRFPKRPAASLEPAEAPTEASETDAEHILSSAIVDAEARPVHARPARNAAWTTPAPRRVRSCEPSAAHSANRKEAVWQVGVPPRSAEAVSSSSPSRPPRPARPARPPRPASPPRPPRHTADLARTAPEASMTDASIGAAGAGSLGAGLTVVGQTQQMPKPRRRAQSHGPAQKSTEVDSRQKEVDNSLYALYFTYGSMKDKQGQKVQLKNRDHVVQTLHDLSTKVAAPICRHFGMRYNFFSEHHCQAKKAGVTVKEPLILRKKKADGEEVEETRHLVTIRLRLRVHPTKGDPQSKFISRGTQLAVLLHELCHLRHMNHGKDFMLFLRDIFAQAVKLGVFDLTTPDMENEIPSPWPWENEIFHKGGNVDNEELLRIFAEHKTQQKKQTDSVSPGRGSPGAVDAQPDDSHEQAQPDENNRDSAYDQSRKSTPRGTQAEDGETTDGGGEAIVESSASSSGGELSTKIDEEAARTSSPNHVEGDLSSKLEGEESFEAPPVPLVDAPDGARRPKLNLMAAFQAAACLNCDEDECCAPGSVQLDYGDDFESSDVEENSAEVPTTATSVSSYAETLSPSRIVKLPAIAAVPPSPASYPLSRVSSGVPVLPPIG